MNALYDPDGRIGTVLAGKYKILRMLGEGGFATVYGAVHELTGREVAIKILDAKVARNEKNLKRFFQEARAAAQLKHPNVVDVLDMGTDGATTYLVLELLEGEELAARLEREEKLSLRDTLEACVPIMRALARAHDAGMIHRDIKPENIFISRDGEGRTVPKLLDFGIAKVTGGTKTRTGAVFGTPQYMSPEQALGKPDIGPDTDVWAMGIVFWACLTGELPFDAPEALAVLTQIVTQKLPPFLSVAPELGADFCAVIDKALASDRSRRFPRMEPFMEALLREAEKLGAAPAGLSLATGPHTVTSPNRDIGALTPAMSQAAARAVSHAPTLDASSISPEATRPGGRSPLIWIGAAGVVAALIAAVAFLALREPPGEPSEGVPAEVVREGAVEPAEPSAADGPAEPAEPAEPSAADEPASLAEGGDVGAAAPQAEASHREASATSRRHPLERRGGERGESSGEANARPAGGSGGEASSTHSGSGEHSSGARVQRGTNNMPIIDLPL